MTPRERPIPFSAPMVRALLEGRKTQTRRILKRQPDHHWESLPGYRLDMVPQPVDGGVAVRPVHSIPVNAFDDSSPRTSDLGPWVTCPYGGPGDRLWVRETWGLHAYGDFTYWNRDSIRGRTEDDVRATWEVAYLADSESAYDHWRPSIHMPRWASRIDLDVTGVRVERLQAISEEDAKEEGADSLTASLALWKGHASQEGCRRAGYGDAPENTGDWTSRDCFRLLWGAINGPDSWAANPWVWVVTFRRVRP